MNKKVLTIIFLLFLKIILFSNFFSKYVINPAFTALNKNNINFSVDFNIGMYEPFVTFSDYLNAAFSEEQILEIDFEAMNKSWEEKEKKWDLILFEGKEDANLIFKWKNMFFGIANGYNSRLRMEINKTLLEILSGESDLGNLEFEIPLNMQILSNYTFYYSLDLGNICLGLNYGFYSPIMDIRSNLNYKAASKFGDENNAVNNISFSYSIQIISYSEYLKEITDITQISTLLNTDGLMKSLSLENDGQSLSFGIIFKDYNDVPIWGVSLNDFVVKKAKVFKTNIDHQLFSLNITNLKFETQVSTETTAVTEEIEYSVPMNYTFFLSIPNFNNFLIWGQYYVINNEEKNNESQIPLKWGVKMEGKLFGFLHWGFDIESDMYNSLWKNNLGFGINARYIQFNVILSTVSDNLFDALGIFNTKGLYMYTNFGFGF